MSLARLLQSQPSTFDELFRGAQILMNEGLHQDALTWAKRAAAQQPNNPQIRLLLASIYYLLRKPFEAIKQLKKALKLRADYSSARLLLAKTYCSIDRVQDAAKCIDAGKISTELPLERLTYADVLARTGKLDNAKNIILGEIGAGRALPASILRLVELPGMHWDPTHVELIETLLTKTEWTPDERASLHFSAARIADHEKRFDDAFTHFTQGNKLSDSSFDIAVYRQSVRLIIDLFTADLLQSKVGFGDPSKAPVFIVGLPRSGKSILESILSGHPQIHGVGEIALDTIISPDLALGIRPDLPIKFEEKISGLDARTIKLLSKAYLEEIFRHNRKSKFFINSFPQNFMNIGLLNIVFPNATFINVQRDPIDNSLFCFMKHFLYDHYYSNDLETMGNYYKSYVELMDHWKQLIPDKIIDVHYEKLVSEPIDTVRQVLNSLNLDFDATFMEHSSTRFGTIEAGSEAGPIDTSYITYWKNYEQHIGPLIDALGDLAHI